MLHRHVYIALHPHHLLYMVGEIHESLASPLSHCQPLYIHKCVDINDKGVYGAFHFYSSSRTRRQVSANMYIYIHTSTILGHQLSFLR